MDIAMIGLGRMGANMAQRCIAAATAWSADPGEGARQRAAEAGLEVVDSLAPRWPRCRCRAWCG